jgi:hypothetical protein
MLTNERIAEIRERESKAAKGPYRHSPVDAANRQVTFKRTIWEICDINKVGVCIAFGADGSTADFIAHARQDVPDLLAEVERLRAENAEAIDVIRDYTAQFPDRDHNLSACEGGEIFLAAIEKARKT